MGSTNHKYGRIEIVRDNVATRGVKSLHSPMLYTIAVILVVLWILGLLGHIAGGLIHLLLVIAVILVIINLVSGRRG